MNKSAKKLGFTFIELIISISILILISGVAINSFFNNLAEQSLFQELNLINKTIDILDNRIGKDITDYEIQFNTGTLFYKYSLNNLFSDVTQKLQITGNTGSLTTNDSTGNLWNINKYDSDKLSLTTNFTSTGTFNFNIGSGSYKIVSSINSKNINEINVNYFSNLTDSIIILDSITNASNSYSGIIIKNNIGGKRKIYDMNNNLLTGALLIFDTNGIQTKIQIK